MEKLTHWKKLIDNDYINEGDLFDDYGKPMKIVATITEITKEKVTNPRGMSEDKPVIHFKECKPMVLSAKENFENLEKVTGSKFHQQWVGKQVKIWYNPDVKFGGKKVGGVRIWPRKPEKPKLTKSDTRVQKIRERLEQGRATIEDIQKYFDVETDLLTELKNITNA